MATEFDLMKKAKELADEGKSHADIMLEVHHDEIWVAKSIDIMTKLPEDAIKWLQSGKMSRNAAISLASVAPEKMEAVWKIAVELYKKESK